MRKAVNAFTELGLAIVECDKMDLRCRFIRSTPKPTALAEDYLKILADLAIGRSTAHNPEADL